ncbi:hypothetical protein DUI87_09990 [Hirundo rustica rustica]|uniref:Uncharacterized protein n=1 Tax=Hirundo rustica rustica TaxID=333673 RepID=A0A3M0KH38_HIRRU|nr:hypothetical protein DUI87_09990 [Hirundo rustica rustica]
MAKQCCWYPCQWCTAPGEVAQQARAADGNAVNLLREALGGDSVKESPTANPSSKINRLHTSLGDYIKEGALGSAADSAKALATAGTFLLGPWAPLNGGVNISVIRTAITKQRHLWYVKASKAETGINNIIRDSQRSRKNDLKVLVSEVRRIPAEEELEGQFEVLFGDLSQSRQ